MFPIQRILQRIQRDCGLLTDMRIPSVGIRRNLLMGFDRPLLLISSFKKLVPRANFRDRSKPTDRLRRIPTLESCWIPTLGIWMVVYNLESNRNSHINPTGIQSDSLTWVPLSRRLIYITIGRQNCSFLSFRYALNRLSLECLKNVEFFARVSKYLKAFFKLMRTLYVSFHSLFRPVRYIS